MQGLILVTPRELTQKIKEAVKLAFDEKLNERIKDPKELYSRKEAAQLLGMTVSTIDRMFADGTLDRIKIRSKSYVKSDDLFRLISEGKQH